MLGSSYPSKKQKELTFRPLYQFTGREALFFVPKKHYFWYYKQIMNEKFLKPYNPQDTESRIYKLWEESGFFNPNNLPERHKEAYTIMMPPPNVTGVLHMGHEALRRSEEHTSELQSQR